MLSRIIPVLIIFLFCFCTVIADIDEFTNADETLPETPPENYLLVRPGENVSISFRITCHLLGRGYYNDLIDIPVPEIYTYNCSIDAYHHAKERTYEYLTCSVYDEVNLTELMKTFTVPVNVTFEYVGIFYVNYIFSPPKDEYSNSTVFFIQNIEDKILYLGDASTTTETEMDFWWIWLIFIPFGVIAFISLYQMYDSGRRRRRRETRRRIERVERLMQIRNELSAYRRASSPSSIYEPKKELLYSPPLPTVFKCRKVKELREFVKGDGLFEVGIKKSKVPSFEEQVTMISKMPEVEEFIPTSLEVMVNLNEYGKYFLKLKSNPTAHRIENDSSVSYRNPYIHNQNFHLCLGNGQKLYNRCYQNKHYVECIRVLCEVLKSKHGSGYRKWSDCGM